ncbi:MAG: sodium:solute symporter, partial [Bacteroidetes bacterium]|nr:sodium:solute symporter [Bacteroidota bacterium]
MRNPIDWIVMAGTILFIVMYGIWKSRGAKDIKGYLLSNKDMKWWTIGLSIMATQASDITFLSTPGQAFDDGMRFVQFYFGVPIAMVIIASVIIPIYRKLNVFTAYEYLEGRFDLKTCSFAAILFLISRSLASGVTIVAPAIIFSTILKWDLSLTCIGIGVIVMVYTVLGGTKAVSQTQQQQMAVILVGMVIAAVVMVYQLPPEVSFGDAVNLAGRMGKLNTLTMPDSFDSFIKDRYNILSGLIAGSFLALSYFGTDQSQVQRYLGGKSITEIRVGLLFNGIFKVPMQFAILFVGAMMFVFFQFNQAPFFFNDIEHQKALSSETVGTEYQQITESYDQLASQGVATAKSWAEARGTGDQAAAQRYEEELLRIETEKKELKDQGVALMKQNDENADTNDLDRIFLTFVLTYLPPGIVGLLIAVILSAAMSSTSAELNALASTTLVDIYKRLGGEDKSDQHFLLASKGLTFMWGVIAIIFALIAGQFENLIEYVNILGSLFYGTILGIFMVAFFFNKVTGKPTFVVAIIAELIVILGFALSEINTEVFTWDIGFL